MKFLADVNMPQSVISALRKQKHSVFYIKKSNLAIGDMQIVQIAKEEKRIILTRDKDFIALAQFPKYQVAAIVIRLRDQRPEHILKHLTELLNEQDAMVLEQSLTIVNEDAAHSYPYENLN